MKNVYSTAITTLFFVCLLFSGYATAATDIDTSFGDEGFTLQDFEIGDDEGYALAVQDDGKILVAGYSSNGAVKDLIVSRFLEDGTLDVGFNAAGVFSISLGNGDTIGRSLTIAGDGDIIVGGSSYDEGAKVAILRLTPDGFPDNTFGDSGYVTIDVEEGEITSSAVKLTDTGDIVVAATMVPESSNSYALFAKYTNEGVPDTSFGTDGKFSYTDESNDIQIKSLVLQDDGTILGGGSKTEGDNPKALLVQLTSSGEINTEYGENGEILLDLDATSSVINSMVMNSEGELIVAGAVNNGEYDEAFVAKRSSDGSPVSDFATSGVYKTSYSLENSINAVSLSGDSTILAVGFMTSSNSKDFFVLTLEEESESQTTAVTFLETDIARADDIGYAAVALSSDSLLAAGSSSNGSDLDVALLRYTGNGSLSAGEATGSTEGIVTAGFRITTKEVNSITRVSVVSGGIIEQFSNSEEDVTVARKGVVYGTKPNPAYTEDDEEEEDGDDSDDTEPTESATSTTTSGVFNNSDSDGSIFPDSNNYYIVRLGNTNDGEGTEAYTSNVENITPGTTYYLRAYAVLSNGDVLYGNEYRFTTDDACFIATAAYGSIFEKHVVLLRQFRDNYLLTNAPGEKFVALYYAYSPEIADFIRTSDFWKTAVKIALFPVILLAMFLLHTTLITKIFFIGGGLTTVLFLFFKHFTSFRISST